MLSWNSTYLVLKVIDESKLIISEYITGFNVAYASILHYFHCWIKLENIIEHYYILSKNAKDFYDVTVFI